MKLKYKALLIIMLLVTVVFGSGITYSIFTSEGNLSGNQGVASFIFKSNKLNHIELPITDMNPADKPEEYNFSVTNTDNEKKSEVAVNYTISVKTPHLMPLLIELYRLSGTEETLIMTCDETYSRNANNELVCESDMQELPISKSTPDNYKVKVSYVEDCKNEVYSNLIDYIDLDINSWQKIDKVGE